MKASTVFSALFVLAVSAVCNAQGQERVTWSGAYGDPTLPLSGLACSQWAAENGYETLADVPGYPAVGGIVAVNGTNTANCGQCYLVLNEQEPYSTIFVAVDAAGAGIVTSLAAMNTLTNGQAEELGSITAFVTAGHSTCNA